MEYGVRLVCLVWMGSDGLFVFVCQSCEVLIHVQKQYEVQEAIADVPMYIHGSNSDDK